MKDAPKVTTYVISVAAELAGMHPQTLRQYDRLGLVTPARTKGHGRRYTRRDIERLRSIQRLSQEEGINLAGIRRILDLEEEVERLRGEAEQLTVQLRQEVSRRSRIFAAGPSGAIEELRVGERFRGGQAAAGTMRPAAGVGELVPASSWGNERLVSLIAALNALGVRPVWARRQRLLESGRSQD